MRNLELDIEEIARTSADFDLKSEDERTEALDRVNQLKIEKRDAMDRCEKKNVLSTGAAESMHRRLQGGSVASKRLASVEKMILSQNTEEGSSAGVRQSTSPVPSRVSSQVSTLSSTGQSWETVSNSSPTVTPTCEQSTTGLAVDPPTNRISSGPITSSANIWQTVEANNDVYTVEYTAESPTIPVFPPPTPHSAVTPAPPPDISLHREMNQLFSAGLSLFGEPEDYEFPIDQDHRRTLSFDLPIQNPENNHNQMKPTSIQATTPPSILNSNHDLLFRSQSGDSWGIDQSSVDNDKVDSPLSTFPEPSLSRRPSVQLIAGSIRRQSRALLKPNRKSLRLDKPLPPIVGEQRAKERMITERSPKPVIGFPILYPMDRFYSTVSRDGQLTKAWQLHGSQSVIGLRTPQQPRFTPMPAISDNSADGVLVVPTVGEVVDYETTPIETLYKFHTKDSCFATYLSPDAKHAIYLSPHSFQVFAIPLPGETPQLRPKFHYRYGDWEGLKRSRTNLQYKSAAASDRYVATITNERVG
jgi:hypothetical protein